MRCAVPWQEKKEAGEAMALGQYVAGMGFSNVGLGLVHGMAHPLGAFTTRRTASRMLFCFRM